jgi:hypothetical protein
VLQTRDTCLIVDADCFLAIPLPDEADQDSATPDICIGTDPIHPLPSLTHWILASLAS